MSQREGLLLDGARMEPRCSRRVPRPCVAVLMCPLCQGKARARSGYCAGCYKMLWKRTRRNSKLPGLPYIRQRPFTWSRPRDEQRYWRNKPHTNASAEMQ